jgi:hypothetical protein
MARTHDFAFDPRERLLRRINKGDVNGVMSLKPSALKLQVSVSRTKHDDGPVTPNGDKNGLAEIMAGDAVALSYGSVIIVCVDEPSHHDDRHAVMAMVAPPGAPVAPESLSALRALLASKMRVVKAPT